MEWSTGAIGEARVAKAGADSEYAPMFHVLHVDGLAQALDDGIVVDHKKWFVAVDERQLLHEFARQAEIVVFPITGKILSAFSRWYRPV